MERAAPKVDYEGHQANGGLATHRKCRKGPASRWPFSFGTPTTVLTTGAAADPKAIAVSSYAPRGFRPTPFFAICLLSWNPNRKWVFEDRGKAPRRIGVLALKQRGIGAMTKLELLYAEKIKSSPTTRRENSAGSRKRKKPPPMRPGLLTYSAGPACHVTARERYMARAKP